MTVQFSNHAAPFFATSRNILFQEGIELTIGDDFDAYAKIVEEEREVQKLGAPFNPKLHELNEKNAFWMTARNADGELIHTQASKILPLGGLTLAAYLMRHFRSFPPPLPGVDDQQSRFRATPGAHRITGRIAYHGEFWIAPERGKYRGVGLAAVLGRSGMFEMMHRWDPDFICGFILNTVAFKGFAARLGYLHLEPNALKWVVEGKDRPIDTFLTYNSRDDLHYLFDIPLHELEVEAAA